MGREVQGARTVNKPNSVVKSNGVANSNGNPGISEGAGNKKLNTTALKSTGAGNTQAHLSPSKAGANGTANADPTPSTTKDSETSSPKTPLLTRKHADDDDSWSVTSSTITSVRTARSRVTVGTAPTLEVLNVPRNERSFTRSWRKSTRPWRQRDSSMRPLSRKSKKQPLSNCERAWLSKQIRCLVSTMKDLHQRLNGRSCH